MIANHVNYFKVLDKFPESDHRPISLFLHMNYKHNDRNTLTEEPGWQVTQRYVWCRDNLDRISHLIYDETSGSFYGALCNSISNLVDTNTVAEYFDFNISQACERAFNRARYTRKNKKGPVWFDPECRSKRSIAIKAGERVTTQEQKQRHVHACREYKACKQKKQRKYANKCIEDIRHAFSTNRSNMWCTINRIGNENRVKAEPSDNEFYEYFKDLSSQQDSDYFYDELENAAVEFWTEYDSDCKCESVKLSLIEEIINSNFTQEEIICAINSLKPNHSPGIDGVSISIQKFGPWGFDQQYLNPANTISWTICEA